MKSHCLPSVSRSWGDPFFTALIREMNIFLDPFVGMQEA